MTGTWPGAAASERTVTRAQRSHSFRQQEKIFLCHKKNKYKNISAYSFTTFNNELVISFDGFEEQTDILEFADFVFAKIKMKYWHTQDVPTFH